MYQEKLFMKIYFRYILFKAYLTVMPKHPITRLLQTICSKYGIHSKEYGSC